MRCREDEFEFGVVEIIHLRLLHLKFLPQRQRLRVNRTALLAAHDTCIEKKWVRGGRCGVLGVQKHLQET